MEHFVLFFAVTVVAYGYKGGELLSNFHRVNSDIFRSEQPTKLGMESIEKKGIKTILNLRHFRTDNREAKNTSLTLKHVSINTWTISYEEIETSLKIIRDAEKPILIHCKHGSDRTGCIVAAYRMAYDNWTKEEAIAEFVDPKYGYHAKLFPKILTLLESIDIESLKKELLDH